MFLRNPEHPGYSIESLNRAFGFELDDFLVPFLLPRLKELFAIDPKFLTFQLSLSQGILLLLKTAASELHPDFWIQGHVGYFFLIALPELKED